MSFIDALCIHPDGSTDRVVLHPDLAPAHELIGHRTEPFRVGRSFIGYAATDADQLGLTANYPATLLCHSFESLANTDHIAGPLIVAELDPGTGDPTSLSAESFSLLVTLAS
jgi:hypothetical protein